MKNIISQKIILGVVAAIFVFSTGIFITPQKAKAQWVVTDIGNTIQDTLSALENAVTAGATLGTNIQTTVLNKIATAIAKQLLMQITNSVISWINSGFNGNPSFIQNPTAFFENIGDQATGAFISQNGALSSLCSPFSLQIRLAIAQQQQQNDGYGNQNQYACTLSTIIQNTTNAVNGGVGVSVQGFVGGDFSQGGWPAFEALVTQPQNTPNGAYLTAEDQLQQQIAAQTTQKQNELNQGSGFLSWESCTPNSGNGTTNNSANTGTNNSQTTNTSQDSALQQQITQLQTQITTINQQIAADQQQIPQSNSALSANCTAYDGSFLSSDPICVSLQTKVQNLESEVTNLNSQIPTLQNQITTLESQQQATVNSNLNNSYNTSAENDPNQTCSMQTPGSVISATLNKHLAVPTENLELANSIDDIINAAFSELVVVALQKGLTSVTSTSNGGSSYLQSAITSANSQSFSSTRNTLLNTVTPYLDNAKTVDANYGTALNLILTASSTIGNALSCYQNIGQGTTTSSFWGNGPTTLQNTLTTTVIPLAELTMSEGGTASTTDGQYQQMYQQILNATTLSDLNNPEQTLTSISTSGGFPTTATVKASANDLSSVESTINPIQQQAQSSLQQCRSLTGSTNGTTGTTSTTTYGG